MLHPFPPGTRVRHYGQQYSSARMHGTAVVLAATPSGNDYEYQVQRDEALIPGTANTPTLWASYMTYPALEVEPEVSL